MGVRAVERSENSDVASVCTQHQNFDRDGLSRSTRPYYKYCVLQRAQMLVDIITPAPCHQGATWNLMR